MFYQEVAARALVRVEDLKKRNEQLTASNEQLAARNRQLRLLVYVWQGVALAVGLVILTIAYTGG